MKLLALVCPLRGRAVDSALQRGTPALFGVPFFYWFQLLLIPVSALAIYAADRVGKA